MARHKTGTVFLALLSFCTALVLSSINSKADEKTSGVIAPTELTYGMDTLTVEPNGTYVIETEDEKTLLDESGRDSFSKRSFTFNDQLSSIDVLTAETIKKDGRRIPVKPEQIRLQEEPEAIGAPIFTTSKIKTIIFPDIEVGDRVHYRIRKTQHTAPLPGNFSYFDYFFPDGQVKAYKLVLNTPEKMTIHVSQNGLSEDPEHTANGRRIRSWTYRQPKPRAVDDGKANMLFHEPYFLLSTFDSWKALAAAYQERALDKVLVTPEIQQLADDLTRGTTDRREQTRKLYDWVRDNIRYVALYLADGGYVPHLSADILRNRYGDCKDHVVLLEALLKAKGIESYGALISTGTNFLQSPIAVPALFDHVITYVPEFDLYLDSTQRYLPFGELGFRLSSKPALHLEGPQDIVVTPPLEATANRRVSTLKLTLQSNGAFSGQTEQLFSGSIGHYVRSWIGNMSPLTKNEIIAQALSNQGLKGDGTLEFDPPTSNAAEFRAKVDFHVTDSSFDFSRPEALTITSPVNIADTIADAVSFSYAKPDMQFPILCMAVDLTDNYEIRIPEQTTVLALPPSVDIAEGSISYKATYQKSGDLVRINRRYVMTVDKGYCTPQEIEKMTTIGRAVQKDLSTRLMLAPKP